jgi:serine/threonine-protein kinase
MAPEQMLAAKDADLRADIWAIGAILFELLTGRTVFEGDTMPEICAAVVSVTPKRVTEFRPEIPTPLADAIERCLKRAPVDRFGNVAELAAELAPFGSPSRSAASLKRIQRVLTRSTPGGGLSPLPPSLVALKASQSRPFAPVAAEISFHAPATGTTSGAGAMVSPSERGHSPRWIVALVGVLAVGVLGTIGWVRMGHANRGEAASGMTIVPASQQPAPPQPALPQPALANRLDPSPAPPAGAPLAESRPPEALPLDAALSTPPRATAAPAPAPRARPPAHLIKQPPVPAASTPPVPSTEAKVHRGTEAWDPNAFGPRR